MSGKERSLTSVLRINWLGTHVREGIRFIYPYFSIPIPFTTFLITYSKSLSAIGVERMLHRVKPIVLHGTHMTCLRKLWISKTNNISKYSRVLLERLIVTQLVKKSLPFYGTLRFITVFTRSRHWSMSWARWIQSKPSHLKFIFPFARPFQRIRQCSSVNIVTRPLQDPYTSHGHIIKTDLWNLCLN
jgi:hypothetical protein